MFDGYLQLGGTEIMNAARTAAYVAKNAPSFPFRNRFNAADLRIALGHNEYESPLVDDAPWSDESNPATQRFYGLYPLSIKGDMDSTREAPITEAIMEGGTVGQVRHATREILVKALLFAQDRLALDAGMSWLRSALDPSPCGDHGGTCTGATLCYYADAPVIDPNAVDWDAPMTETFRFGRLTRDTSPLLHRLQHPGPAKVTWDFDEADGAVIQYGGMALRSQDVIYSSPEIALQRTNYLIDPSFERAQSWWSVDSEGLSTRVGTGGVDGGAFQRNRRIYPTIPTVVRTNYAPNPSAIGNPQTTGWRSNTVVFAPVEDEINPISDYTILASHGLSSSGFGEGAFGLTPFGGAGFGSSGFGEGAFGLTDSFMGSDASADPISVMIPILGPTVNPTTGRVSVWLRRNADTQFVRVIDYTGATVAQMTVPPITANFQRVNLTAPIMIGGNLEIGTVGMPTGPVGIMGLLIEEGTGAFGTHFHGDGEDTDTVRYSYRDSQFTSPSIELVGDFTEYSFTSGSTTSPSGPVIFSVALRSTEAAEVRLEIVSEDGLTIHGTNTVRPGINWERFAVATTKSRNVRIRITAVGALDVDQGLLERGTYLMPYFDGSVGGSPEYTTSWVGGTVGQAMSLIRWNGAPMYQRDNDRWRPFVRVLHGVLPGFGMTVTQYGTVPIDLCAAPYERQFHDTTCTYGPIEKSTTELSTGIMMEVQFILVSGSPAPFGSTRIFHTGPIAELDWDAFTDVAPPVQPVSVIVDPNCPPIPAPPRPPSIPDLCVGAKPNSWRRHRLEIPASEVAAWAGTVPTIKLTTVDDVVRQVRVRFHPNPFGFEADEVDPHSYCSEFILSYMPKNTELLLDGTVERAAASVAGASSVPANNLLYASDGSPMTWPELSCGIGYVMTIDTPVGTADEVELELALTRKG